MHRPIRLPLIVAAAVLTVAALAPLDAFAQRSRGQGQARPAGGGSTAVSRGTARGPSHATPAPAPTGRTAVRRAGRVHYPVRYYRHHRYYPYYGWGWGGWGGWGSWGSYYYPPFMSFYGWYPYPFGWYPPYYAFGPYDTSASVRVQVTPREAEVYVDGYYAGIVDEFDGTFQRLNMTPGSHEITIYLPGYRSATERRYFRPNAGYKIRQALEKLPSGAPDEPKPQPAPQAEPSPVQRGGGREPWDLERERRAPEPRWPDPVAEPRMPRPPRAPRDPGEPSAARSTFGNLVVRVQPAGASIVIDGERWQGPDAQDRLSVQLAEGRHEVEITKDGHAPYSAEVDVRAGETTVLNVSLPPADRR